MVTIITLDIILLFTNIDYYFDIIEFITNCSIFNRSDLLSLCSDSFTVGLLGKISIPVSTNATIISQTQKDEFIENLRIHAVKFYQDAKLDQDQILSENKGKSGIYLWYNRINGHFYVGQSKKLGDNRSGRLINYYKKSYLSSSKRGDSLIRKALLKYGHENFCLIILEYCSIDLLDSREQHWINFLNPYYNILKFVKSSRGYKHTEAAINKMRGPRPNLKLTPEHLAKIGSLAKNRIYDLAFRVAVSKRFGFTVYVYDKLGKLLNTFSSIIKFKEAYGIKFHHKTIYKKISQGILINGLKVSFSPISSLDLQATSIVSIANSKVKARQIQLTNIVDPNLSKALSSISAAAAYIKEVDGKCDRSTIRKYINSDKLYHNIWKLDEI